MPYFQRDHATGAVLPVDAAAVATTTAAAAMTAVGIVEKAAAILDSQAIGSAAGAPKLAGLGGLGAPFTDLAGLPDLQRRLSEALADLLKLLVPPEQAAPAAAAVRALSRSLSTVPMVESDCPAAAGSTAAIPLPLINDGAEAANVRLYSTDFVSDNGHEIPALHATFSPHALSLGSGSQGKSTMQVSVPAQTAPGIYSALVQAVGLGRPCAVVMLRIE